MSYSKAYVFKVIFLVVLNHHYILMQTKVSKLLQQRVTLSGFFSLVRLFTILLQRGNLSPHLKPNKDLQNYSIIMHHEYWLALCFPKACLPSL